MKRFVVSTVTVSLVASPMQASSFCEDIGALIAFSVKPPDAQSRFTYRNKYREQPPALTHAVPKPLKVAPLRSKEISKTKGSAP